jgi:hypothetical protein
MFANINNLIFINYRIFIILGIRDSNIENQLFTNITQEYLYNINSFKNYNHK